MSIADSLVDPDAAMDHVEIRHALRPLLAGLPDRERQTLLLRFVENKTQSEIADVLGVSQVHVSRLLAKTLAQLRRQLPDVHILDHG
jgi:RNA polymerase sigma-B factor